MNILKKVKKYIDFKILLKAVCTATVLLMCVNIAGFGQRYDNIRSNVLRLHILANSNSAEDQNLKLKVRDAVLECSEQIFKNCSTENEARNAAANNLETIRDTAQQTVEASGYDYAVLATICDMWFEDRVYDTFTLPAGVYEAVRVTIGEGEGKNWWCVMFPGICLPSAEEADGLETSLSKEEADMCERPARYTAKFKVVEWFNRVRVGLQNWFK